MGKAPLLGVETCPPILIPLYLPIIPQNHASLPTAEFCEVGMLEAERIRVGFPISKGAHKRNLC